LVGAGALALAALTGLTVVVLGPETYRAYIQDVLPEIHWFRVGWNNASLMGFWSRLFDPAPERERLRSRTEPLLYSPALARAGAWLSSALVVAVLAWVVRRVRARADEDLAFGLAVTAMLLISPIAWDHYFLLLLVPLTVVWLGLPPSRWAKLSLLAIVLTLWLNPAVLWTAFDLGGRVARPIHALTVLSCPMYALLGLFSLGILELNGGSRGMGPASSASGDNTQMAGGSD
ncbi:MAG: hypothetical protein IRY99_19760, partial [Isosphaeraceae bacterium]|nr:hypothetical protein [Isosphaeraceae bacterium]